MTLRGTLTAGTVPLQYVPNLRTKLQYVCANQELVSASNPLGWNGFHLDTADGVKRLAAAFLPGSAIADVLILWAVGGFHPRGNMYRWDGWNCAPGVDLSAIANAIAPLRLGIAVKPSRLPYPLGWAYDGDLQLDYRNADQMNALFAGLKRGEDAGVSAWYFDSFGNTPNDIAMLPPVRQFLGPNVLIYTEYGNPSTIPYAGVYGEVRSYAGSGPPVPTGWGSPACWQGYRAQSPGCDAAIINFAGVPWSEFFKAGMPLLLDGGYVGVLDEIKALQSQYAYIAK